MWYMDTPSNPTLYMLMWLNAVYCQMCLLRTQYPASARWLASQTACWSYLLWLPASRRFLEFFQNYTCSLYYRVHFWRRWQLWKLTLGNHISTKLPAQISPSPGTNPKSPRISHVKLCNPKALLNSMGLIFSNAEGIWRNTKLWFPRVYLLIYKMSYLLHTQVIFADNYWTRVMYSHTQ